MAELPVLVAVTGAWEAPLVAALERSTVLTVVRRCADLPELLSTASTGRARAALVSADLHRLDRSAVARVQAAGVAVVGLAAPAAVREQQQRLHALGVDAVAAVDAPAVRLEELVLHAVAQARDGTRPAPPGPVDAGQVDAGEVDAGSPGAGPPAGGTAGSGRPGGGPGRHARTSELQLADPAAALGSAPAGSPGSDQDAVQEYLAGELADVPPLSRPGALVAVWGPAGAPGRTTVATTLATELASAGDEVLLVDADTHAASVAQVLGVLDEAPGLAAVCRAAGTGTLAVRSLRRTAVEVGPRLRLLTGITRSSRWPELAPAALERVWELGRTAARWTVVDLAAPLEADEELSYDTAAPRRNGAALTTLAAADVVVVVGAADAVGLQRLVRGLAELAEAVPGHAVPRVVVTRVRASAVGASPETRVRDALRRFAGLDHLHLVPDDRRALDAALLAGRTLTELAPGSPARAALAALAADLRGDERAAVGSRAGRGLRLLGRRRSAG